MLDRCGGLSLAFEAGDSLAFLQIIAIQHVLSDGLYSNPAGLELLVASEIYLPHRPASEPLLKPVSSGHKLSTG